jgi:hypothetical protein
MRIRRHLSFANVISMIALFVALGGASYAAVVLPKNSVKAKQIAKNAVRAPEIKRNAVGASELRSNSVAGGDVADGTLGSADLGDNSVGAGELGDNSVGSAEVTDGSLGANDLQAGLLDFPNITVQHEIAAANLADGTSASYDATCPEGQQAIGGGARGDQTDSEYTVITSTRPLRSGGGFPLDGENFIGWRATVLNPQGNPTTGGFPANPPDGDLLPEVWAICAPAPPPPPAP